VISCQYVEINATSSRFQVVYKGLISSSLHLKIINHQIKKFKMKFTALIVATVALLASTTMADPTNSTVPNNGMGGTLATASISVDNPNAAHSASNKINAGVMAISLTSAVTAAYALM